MLPYGMKDFNPRYVTLDHWRGAAALAVMVFHGFGAMRGGGLESHFTLRWLQRLSDFGWFGVHLFFVISGYCIAANTYRLAARDWSARDFFRDRLLRVYPVYWAACILAVVVGLAALPFNRGSLAGTLPGSPRAMLANILLLEPYLHVNPLLLVSWTLVYEIGFYALITAGIVLHEMGVNRWLLFGLAFALAIIGLLGQPSGLLFVLNFWAEFLCGCCVFLALWIRGRHRLWILFLTVPPVFALLAFLSFGPQQRVVQMSAVAMFALILWRLHPYDRQIAKLPGLRWLANAGVISYSLYLIHIPIGGRVIGVLSRFIEFDSPAYALVQITYWFVALAAATVFYRSIEQPLERWRHRFRRTRVALEGDVAPLSVERQP